MSATSRELIYQTLEFRKPERVPRQVGILPWAAEHYPDEVRQMELDFPADIDSAVGHQEVPSPIVGDRYGVGRHVDAWGCEYENIQSGVIGEVKNPLIKDWDVDVPKVRFPEEWLTIDIDRANQDHANTDRFTIANCCPRPFEQLQFIRGSEELYIDLADPPEAMLKFAKRVHEFYCRQAEVWAKTDVDAIMFMDDWGSQNALLIRPEAWRELFKWMYRDYIQIIHAAGKKAFMHTDGNILAIFPDLIELDLDAINAQIFCMGLENLKPYAGKITFWGEIDRQHILPHASLEEVDRAVRSVYENLWRDGGCIAQCEFGAGAKPQNVRQVFQTWNAISATFAGATDLPSAHPPA